LRPVILFPRIEAALAAGFGRIRRLAVDDARARLILSARRAPVPGDKTALTRSQVPDHSHRS
jgi:hypothetical protein